MSRPVADVMEDIEFLDSTSVGATEAASRTDFPSAHAMEKWLERHGRTDLWLSLKRRDPAGTHLSGSERKERRLMSVPTTVDTVVALLAEADKSTRARTRNRADKVRALVDDLRETLAAEREDDRLRETARKEVERLERQLAEAKARLRGGATKASIDVGSGVSAADLRKWAADNGIPCPAKGRVPASVVDAYEAQDESA